LGRYVKVPVKSMKGAFKTPTLRDVALTSPYMHNGAYNTLEEVVDEYDRGGDDRRNIDPQIQPLHLSVREKKDLVQFLNTLSSKPANINIPRLPQ
jgi:cytochrome c peroxidase